jgi:shikimate kinase
MIQKQLEQYNIKLTDNQKEILSSYLKDLKSLFQKENIDLDAFYDIENSIIERLVEKKDNITDDYITKILKDL